MEKNNRIQKRVYTSRLYFWSLSVFTSHSFSTAERKKLPSRMAFFFNNKNMTLTMNQYKHLKIIFIKAFLKGKKTGLLNSKWRT